MKWSKAARSMIPTIFISSAVMAGIGALVYRSSYAVPFACGAFLLAAFNIYKVYLLDRTVRKVVDMADNSSVKGYIQIQYFTRFLLTGAVVVAAYYIPLTGLFGGGPDALEPQKTAIVLGACAGVFSFNIAKMCLRFFDLSEDDAGARPIEEEGD